MTVQITGQLDIVDSQGRRAFQFDADNRRIVAWDEADHLVLRFFGRPAQLYIGGEGNEGDFYVTDGGGQNFLQIDSGNHRIYARDGEGHRVLTFFGNNAQLYVGGEGNEGDLYIVHPSGVNTIQLDGHSGDIILRSADAAEEFSTVGDEGADPGTVVVLDGDGAVRPGHQPYDRRVAGIVSGAGEYRQGILLDRQDRAGRVPVAMMGKAACKVDATFGAVDVGDLLTTSTTVGHAMRASERRSGFGAVFGKSLGRLDSGRGLVPVLVALQ